MAKQRVAITLDEDVLEYIDAVAASKRLERSAYINALFAEYMNASPTPNNEISTDMAPGPKRRKGKAQP
jgi:metal-responsive CopG/Arc/MetJ family transcriptional regulator